ncbi:hypothetical protein [Saccharopolyspora gregorii]|uniref:hypothetical protein n=1 Tax=Saccharopolyspora gregorii TaxID=33914 RepID=UPI0031E597CB
MTARVARPGSRPRTSASTGSLTLTTSVSRASGACQATSRSTARTEVSGVATTTRASCSAARRNASSVLSTW